MQPQTIFLTSLLVFSLTAHGQEKFRGSETVVVPPEKKTAEKVPENSRVISIKPGEIREVYSHEKKRNKTEYAFYIPAEGTGVIQLVVEKKIGKVTYFVKGLSKGKALGGVVERAWLDSGGYRSKDLAHESRIQNALKEQPYIITVDDTLQPNKNPSSPKEKAK